MKAATKIEMWPLHKVRPYPKNAKMHPKKQVEHLAKIIEAHGFDQPIVVDGTGVIIKGHGRLLAAEYLALSKVPVVVRGDLTPAQVREARIADNRVAEMGAWDNDTLLDDVRESMTLEDFNLDVLGLKSSFVDAHKLLGEVIEPETPEPPKNPVTKFGDVWYMGEHVLTCGDSTKAKLKKAPHTIFTDPPYGVSWKSRSNRAKKFDTIKNDDLRGDELAEFLRASIPEAEFKFVCCNWRSFSTFEGALGVPNNCIVWDKESVGLGHDVFYRPQHEFVLFYGEGKRDNLTDVWQVGRERNYKHPTQKPVTLVAKALTDVDAQNVFDPFGGSGTTLLAAEQLGIPCSTIEIEPKYCDVIIERWQTLTGDKARRSE